MDKLTKRFIKIFGTYPNNVIALNTFYIFLIIVNIIIKNYINIALMVLFMVVFTTLLTFMNKKFKKDMEVNDKSIEYLNKKIEILDGIDSEVSIEEVLKELEDDLERL